MKKKWQEEWDGGYKGRYYYSIQRKVGEVSGSNRNRKKEDIMSRMRFSHRNIMNKHAMLWVDVNNADYRKWGIVYFYTIL